MKINTILTIITLITLLTPSISAQKYKITKNKVIGWSILATAGFVDGVVEGYEFDGRTSFERKFGADPNGFWGSQSWRNKDNWYARNFGVWDFYHVADDYRKLGYITGGVVITLGEKQKPEHILIDLAASFLISGAAKRVGMNWIRN